MFANRLIISEDTLKKNNLAPRERGRLRYQRLIELENSGKISLLTTRKELAQAVGYSPDNATGVSWVNTMINRGYLSETLRGFENGEFRKEFHTTGKVPDYDNEAAKKPRKRKNKTNLLPKDYEELENSLPKFKEYAKNTDNRKLIIQKGDITITVELSADDIIKMINSII